MRKLARRSLLLSCLALALGGGAAQASTITVTTTADINYSISTCSLRQAVAVELAGSAAGTGCVIAPSAGQDTIILPPTGDTPITLDSQIEIQGGQQVQIVGASRTDPSRTVITTSGSSRILLVDIGAGVNVFGVTLTGGRPLGGTAAAGSNGINGDTNPNGYNGTGGGDGGGVTASVGPDSGSGGAIYVDGGTLNLDHVVIRNNHAASGGLGGFGGQGEDYYSGPGGKGGNGGNGAHGGAIYNDGTLAIAWSTIDANSAGDGGWGGLGGGGGAANQNSGNANGGAGGAGGRGGDGGDGGAIFNNGSLALYDVTLSHNFAGNAGWGRSGGSGGNGARRPNCGGGSGGPAGTPGDGGPGGNGGAIFTAKGATSTVVNSTIALNNAGTGGLGGSGQAAGGGWDNAPVVPGVAGGNGGDAGSGGAIVAFIGSVSITASTLAGNVNGSAGAGAPGGSGSGWLVSDFAHCRGGIGTDGAHGSDGSAGFGAALASSFSGPITTSDTIVSGQGPQCSGAVTDGGHNLTSDASCPGSQGNPKLANLANNGGPTETMSLSPDSAAIDQVPATGAGCPGTDQRGISRPQPAGGMCDIGAYELTPPICQTVLASSTPGHAVNLKLNCSQADGGTLVYQLATNPTFGSATDLNSLDGTLTYTPPAGFSGTDAFFYYATSSTGQSAFVTVTIVVGHAASCPPGQVGAPPQCQPPVVPAALVGSTALLRSGGSGTLTLSCSHKIACAGRYRLQATTGAPAGDASLSHRPARRTVVLAAGSYSVRAHSTGQLRFSLTSAGRAWVRRHHGKLTATLVLQAAGARTLRYALTLKRR